MKWKLPPKIKIYEALGAIADERLEINGNEAKVYSSSRGKFYTVQYDDVKKEIMVNDNGSYWQGYLGYPAIAYLMKIGVIKYNPTQAETLKDIAWKDINTKFKNNFDQTAGFIHELLIKKGVTVSEFLTEIDKIYDQIKNLNLFLLGPKTKPPEGY